MSKSGKSASKLRILRIRVSDQEIDTIKRIRALENIELTGNVTHGASAVLRWLLDDYMERTTGAP